MIEVAYQRQEPLKRGGAKQQQRVTMDERIYQPTIWKKTLLMMGFTNQQYTSQNG